MNLLNVDAFEKIKARLLSRIFSERCLKEERIRGKKASRLAQQGRHRGLVLWRDGRVRARDLRGLA